MKWLPGPRGMLTLLVTIAALALLAYGLSANRPSRSLDEAIAKGKRAPAPPITLASLTTGRPVTLKSLRGKVVLVNVWASWCGPCQGEAPLLQSWYDRIRSSGGTVVGIDTFDVTSDARAFIRQFHLTYPELRDPSGQAKAKLGVTGFPESFVLDRSGHVAALQRGPVTSGFMQGTMLPLLAERT